MPDVLHMTPRARPEETENERLARLETRFDRIDDDLKVHYLTQGDGDKRYVAKGDLRTEVSNIASSWGWRAVWALLGGGGLGAFLWSRLR